VFPFRVGDHVLALNYRSYRYHYGKITSGFGGEFHIQYEDTELAAQCLLQSDMVMRLRPLPPALNLTHVGQFVFVRKQTQVLKNRSISHEFHRYVCFDEKTPSSYYLARVTKCGSGVIRVRYEYIPVNDRTHNPRHRAVRVVAPPHSSGGGGLYDRDDSDYFNYGGAFWRTVAPESTGTFIEESEWVEEVSSGRVARLDNSVVLNIQDNVRALYDKLLTVSSVPVFTGDHVRTGTLSTIRHSFSHQETYGAARTGLDFDVVTLVFKD